MEIFFIIVATAVIVILTTSLNIWLIEHFRQRRRRWRLRRLNELKSKGVYRTQKDIWGDHIHEEIVWKKER